MVWGAPPWHRQCIHLSKCEHSLNVDVRATSRGYLKLDSKIKDSAIV
jgi:hypothetical protein